MLRVPGSRDDLFRVKSRGGDVRIVYSPLEAVKLARENPDQEVVFLAVGFETTAPGNAMALKAAAAEGLTNFSEIVSHVLVPPAMEAILSSPDNRVQGFLAAGHVCTIMGWEEYEPIAAKHHVPIVPTGFEPVDILQGILKTVQLLEQNKPGVENQYLRVVRAQGNPAARAVVDEVYEVCDRKWRGIGTIPNSGLKIRDELAAFDAEKKFQVEGIVTEEPEVCISGEILQGLRKPDQCPAFGTECTPANPLGATMVSSEGACAAYHKYGRKGPP
jgi:hydrogenase expression/formation protein HypD